MFFLLLRMIDSGGERGRGKMVSRATKRTM